VPFVVAAPGLVSRQIRSSRVVSLVDTAPTVLDLVGLPVRERYQGRSMLGSSLGAEQRPARFFADYSLSLLGLRDGRWKFIYEVDSGRSKLFDLDTDPHERINLADRHPEQIRAYAQDLRNWSAAQKHLLNARR
jgi:arylsulfatase A-like enzyme